MKTIYEKNYDAKILTTLLWKKKFTTFDDDNNDNKKIVGIPICPSPTPGDKTALHVSYSLTPGLKELTSPGPEVAPVGDGNRWNWTMHDENLQSSTEKSELKLPVDLDQKYRLHLLLQTIP